MRSSFPTRSPEGPGSAAWLPIGPCWVLCPSVGSDNGTADAAISAAKDNAAAEVEQLFLKVIAILLGWRRARASRRRFVKPDADGPVPARPVRKSPPIRNQ